MNLTTLSAVVLLAGVTRHGLCAQGQFLPDNFSSTGLPAPFVAPLRDRDGVTPLGGADYSVQYYGGPLGTADEALVPLPPVLSLAGQAGTFDGDRITVAGVASGQRARLQLRVWDNEGGTKPGWESATVRGASEAFDSLRLSAPNEGPGLTTPAFGLKGFQLLPAVTYRAAGSGRGRELYENAYYQGFTFRPPSYYFEGFAADGHTAFYSVTPGTNPEPFTGPVEVRWRRFGADLSLRSPVPAPVEWNQWQFAGVSDDGLTVAANFWDGTQHSPRLVRGGTARLLPGARALDLSGDGRFVLLRGVAGEVERLDWRTGVFLELLAAGPVDSLWPLQLSQDGRVALLGSQVWREAGGSATLPAGFLARKLSGNGRTVVGQANARPAYWTEEQGLTVLHAEEPETRGALNDCSFDGKILGGVATTRRGQHQLWRRNDRSYRLAELLPNGANQILAPYGQLEVVRVSRDGRTVFAVGRHFQWLLAGIVTPTDSGLVADLVFPEDGARVALSPGGGPGGTDRLTLPAPKGYRFQLERSAGLSEWTAVGEAIPGNDGELTFDLPGSGDTGFYRVQSAPE